ncbi:MAG: ribonuclease P protein component [Candidatus Doudnabacteria bacterium]|nr:ribonuclease P protein component [Candidatus Doudnabacteria bacterium]
MLPKAGRLAKDQEIKQVFVQGRGFFNPFLAIKYFYKASASPRFAFVISTKVSKKAVVRNRLKRVLRELIRREQYKLVPGDYVLILKPKAALISEAAMLHSLKELLLKARVYK